MKMPHCIKQNIKLEVFKHGSYNIGLRESLEWGLPMAEVGAQRDRKDVNTPRVSRRLIYINNN